MTLTNDIAALLGLAASQPIEVKTFNSSGHLVILRWDPAERWFTYYFDSYGKESCLPISIARMNELEHALNRGRVANLDSWARSAYRALVDAGITSIDPDYSDRKYNGDRKT